MDKKTRLYIKVMVAVYGVIYCMLHFIAMLSTPYLIENGDVILLITCLVFISLYLNEVIKQ